MEILNKPMRGKYQQKTFHPVRYQLVTVYEDQCSKTEGGDDPITLIETAAIYMRDPDCEGVEIYDFQEERNILDFWRWPIDKPIPECYNRYVPNERSK